MITPAPPPPPPPPSPPPPHWANSLYLSLRLFSETAVNIGYSCHLLTDDMADVFMFSGEDFDSVKSEIGNFRQKIRSLEDDTGSKNVEEVKVEVMLLNTMKVTNDNIAASADDVR